MYVAVHSLVALHPCQLLGIALATTGCSLLFVHPAPSNPHPEMPLSCTESRLAPIVDAVYTASSAASVALRASDPEDACAQYVGQERDDCERGQKIGAVVAGIQAIVFGVSSWYGFTRTERCRDVVYQQRRWWWERRTAPASPAAPLPGEVGPMRPPIR